MPGLNLYTSNRTELLADKLAEVLSTARLPPMTPEIIVIPSGGMERYLAFKLADKQQICANMEFPFPNAFINRIFRKVFPEIRERSLFDQKMLTWKIMELLPSFLHRKEFRRIRQYVSNDPTLVKQFQLCCKIANLFDQYTVFRPEMIQKWETGKEGSAPDEQWQAIVWRKIVETASEDYHRAALRVMLFKKLKEDKSVKDSLPERVSIFGVSFLPGFHLDVLNALSHHIEINLFALNPSREFWEDIIPQKYKAKKSVEQLHQGRDIELLHYETGNALLASLGTYGKEFLFLLQNMECREHNEFIEPDDNSMLATLQSDILNLLSRETPAAVSGTDKSIQIHVCHSPLREIEVLHDNLLNFFERDPELTPNDIVVMIPDLEAYVPFIQTAFESPSSSLPHIPYTIADLTGRSSPVINDFFTILDLKKNRFCATSVLSFLDSEAIRNKAGLSEEDASTIHAWIEGTNIRWGIDRYDREQAGMPSTAENTWQAGLDRLFTGYAMSADDDSLFDTILPYHSIEGSDAILLGKCNSFLQSLFGYVNKLDSEKPMGRWAGLLIEMLDNLFAPGEDDKRLFQKLRNTISDLYEQEKCTQFSKKIPFAIIRTFLDSCLSGKEYGKGFITGGVTFCTMLPMRSVPFKIICLAGMNDGSFPRADPSLSFDLIASDQKPGDRSVRKEDCYCFLESILSARETLYLSYTGYCVKDNSLIPPSVPANELTDYLSESFFCSSSDTASIIEQITTHHRLNAFSKEYFLDKPDKRQKLFSYSKENAEAAEASVTGPEPFIQAPLPLPEAEEWRRVTVDNLCSFFTHPVKYFLRNRLGIAPEEAQSVMSDSEPFSIDGLEKYQLEQDLLNRRLSGEKTPQFFNAVKARGVLPHGNPGVSAYNRICENIDTFASAFDEINMRPAEKTFADINLTHNGFTITGRIGTFTDDNLVHFRLAKIKAKDRLRIWISHVILNLLDDGTLPRTGMLFGKETNGKTHCLSYAELGNAKEHLTTLLNLYQEGLRRPVAFYPETSFSYADAVNNGKTLERAVEEAFKTWRGSQYSYAESGDAYYTIYPGKIERFDNDFTETALKIWVPILTNEQQVNV